MLLPFFPFQMHMSILYAYHSMLPLFPCQWSIWLFIPKWHCGPGLWCSRLRWHSALTNLHWSSFLPSLWICYFSILWRCSSITNAKHLIHFLCWIPVSGVSHILSFLADVLWWRFVSIPIHLHNCHRSNPHEILLTEVDPLVDQPKHNARSLHFNNSLGSFGAFTSKKGRICQISFGKS